uniref:Uncharacterized protein n=1 Tax=Megaselia scalaris TaxID=36166 RepID=T1GW60_MEGSC
MYRVPSETVAIQTPIVQNKSSAISSGNLASSTIRSLDLKSKNIKRTTLNPMDGELIITMKCASSIILQTWLKRSKQIV